MNYELTAEQFNRALSEMKARRAGLLEHVAFRAVQLLIGLRVTSPFGWAVRHQAAFRALLGLK